MRIIDISQKIHPGMKVYPGDPPFQTRSCLSFRQGDMCEVSEMTIGSHCGTHIDAPLHMIPGGAGVEALPLDSFIGPCRVLTLPVQVITERMLTGYEIKPGERILLRTDPEGAYASKEGALSMDAARYLLKQGVKLIGIDSPSVENMELSDGEIHRLLLSAGVAVLEGLRLEAASDGHYLLSALPLFLSGENGAPCRAVLVQE